MHSARSRADKRDKGVLLFLRVHATRVHATRFAAPQRARADEPRVQVRLSFQLNYALKVAVVYVRMHAKEPLEDVFADSLERLWKGDVCKKTGPVVVKRRCTENEKRELMRAGAFRRANVCVAHTCTT